MITRVTTLMTTSQLLLNIDSSQDALNDTEEELSTGKRINEPSDDPYGASLAVSLNGQLASLSDYAGNVTDGSSFTSTGLSAMSDITSQLNTVQELVTQANTGTDSPSDRQAAANEVTQIIAGVRSDANAQYNGTYVFAGSGQTTPPYTDSSDSFQGVVGGTVSRAIAPGSSAGSSVVVNAQLYTVLNGPNNDDTGLLSQLQSIQSALAAGDAPGASALSGLATSLGRLENQQASLGAAQDRLQAAGTRIQSLQTSTTSALSSDEDVNMAQTLTTYSNEQAAFSAALKAGANIVQTSLMDFLAS